MSGAMKQMMGWNIRTVEKNSSTNQITIDIRKSSTKKCREKINLKNERFVKTSFLVEVLYTGIERNSMIKNNIKDELIPDIYNG